MRSMRRKTGQRATRDTVASSFPVLTWNLPVRELNLA